MPPRHSYSEPVTVVELKKHHKVLTKIQCCSNLLPAINTQILHKCLTKYWKVISCLKAS